MSIRTKFFALAGVILVLFGCVVGVLAIFQQQSAHQLRGIVEYDQKLRRLLADLDVATSDYELHIERLRRRPDQPRAELEKAASSIAAMGGRIRDQFNQLAVALDAALAYSRNDPRDLEELARVQGALPLIAHQIEPFIAAGKETVDAVLAGNPEAAQRSSLGFARFEDAFGPDLGRMRAAVTALTETAARSIYDRMRLDTELSFALFILASALGLGISSLGSEQVVKALRRLLASTRAMEEGKSDVTALVVTRDEVGELARAFNRMVAQLRERERIKETFGRFVDPRIVTRLIGSPGGAPEPAERKVVTIFFSDIRGFSSIGETLTAAALVNLLNAYYTAAGDEIRRHNGIIDKYIGDGIMAFWCSPFSAGDEHASDGCKAALAQQAAIAELRKRLPEITGLRRDAPDLVVRMGLATGEVVVGTLGSPNACSYTVIGDVVTLASRLERVNKLYGTSVIVAEDTWRLAQDAVEARELDLLTVAGKSEPIRIYELMSEAGRLDPARTELRETFAAGLAAYRRQDWDTAESAFTACRALVPEDEPSRVYLDRIAGFRRQPPGAGWDAVWHVDSK